MRTQEQYDYQVRTLREVLQKYSADDAWCAEFECTDFAEPIIICPVGWLKEKLSYSDLMLYPVENEGAELPACIIDENRKTIMLKANSLSTFLSFIRSFN